MVTTAKSLTMEMELEILKRQMKTVISQMISLNQVVREIRTEAKEKQTLTEDLIHSLDRRMTLTAQAVTAMADDLADSLETMANRPNCNRR